VFSRIYQHSIGLSVQGREIIAETNFDPEGSIRPGNVTLIIAGLHGDEKGTIALTATFREALIATQQVRSPLILIPLANPDGFVANTRYNANGVDLNRNCDAAWSTDSEEPSGPRPWSEPESRALRDLIIAFEPAKIVSLHWALAELDPDGPQSAGLAQRMWNAMTPAQRAPYRLRIAAAEPGQPVNPEGFCPGSFGQWCGYNLRYTGNLRPAMVTLELPYDPAAPNRPHPLPNDHLDDLHTRWTEDPAAYLAAVEPAVHRMLAAVCQYPR
jgi:hypothetical protein